MSYIPNVDVELCNFIFRSFELQVLNVKDKCYSLEINSLLKPIVPDKSTVKVNTYIYLHRFLHLWALTST